jgi:hypothetical protein
MYSRDLNIRKYSEDESRSILDFLKKNNLYRFMKGLQIYRKMEELRLVVICSVGFVA